MSLSVEIVLFQFFSTVQPATGPVKAYRCWVAAKPFFARLPTPPKIANRELQRGHERDSRVGPSP